ncbi:hypothetical protein ACROYT_G002841 [Oculina patagonica]
MERYIPVMSKTRVARVWKITLSRIELMAAVITAKLCTYVKRAIDCPISHIFCLTDNSSTLYWIRGAASQWKPFVANRVIEIQSLLDPSVWRYCRGPQNPADLPSRGLPASKRESDGKDPLGCKSPKKIGPRIQGQNLSVKLLTQRGRVKIVAKPGIAEFTVSASLILAEVCLENLSFRDDIDLICLAIKLLFSSIQQWRNSAEDSQTDVNETKADERDSLSKTSLQKLSEKVVDKLKRTLGYAMPDNYQSDALLRELEVWSVLLKVSDGSQGFEEYRRYLTEQFIHRAKRVKETCLVEIFCELNLEVYDRAIGESISKLGFEAVEKITESRQGADASRAFKSLRSSSLRGDAGAVKYGQLLSMLLTKSWRKTNQPHNSSGLDPGTVEFLLTWNPMAGYFHFFGAESGRGSILTDEGQETLSMAQSVLTAVVESLSNASVTVEILILLKKYKEKFLELLKKTFSAAKEGTKANAKEESEKCLAERIEEFDEFHTVKLKVVSFVNMCDLIQPVNITSVKEKSLQEVSLCQIRQLCERKGDRQIEVKFFELPPVAKEVFLRLQNVRESLTFEDLWTQYGKKAQTTREKDEAKKPHLSISEVVENVWKPSLEDWNQHAASTMDGTITLGNVDKLFDSYKNRRKELEQELLRMFKRSQSQTASSAKNLQAIAVERVVQIQRYQQLEQYASAAETIWEFKGAMGFTGDFKVVDDLRNQLSIEFKNKPLNSIGKSFSEAGRALECLDVSKAKCFQAVVDSRQLVEWLRTTITSTQELKVLVDLALISAGESDMETDRISSLHTSCLGFAPLIFDLRESEELKVNFDQLVKACDPVWKAVETDHTLPQKLRDTSRHLEWLKTVKESHGSVAMTSLVQAKTINSSGVYVVGHSDTKTGPSTERGRRLSLNDVIRLTVPTKDGREEMQSRTYSVDELKDLQSKLMLIAGKAEKGKDEVEQFNLEGVMRLATAYINLSESGFVHRLQWNKEFDCSKDQREGESIAEELAAESTSMENCHLNWKKKVSDARKEYRELNFFTTQQLMLLRKEIAAVCYSNDLLVSNLQVFSLLEDVRPNLDTKQLKSAIQRAFRDTNLLEKTRSTADLPSFSQVPLGAEFSTRRSVFDNNNYASLNPSTTPVQGASIKKPKPKDTTKIERFLNAATDDGYSEQVALAALASLGVDADEDDLLMWCLEEADEADIEALYEEAKQNPIIVREIFSDRELDDEMHVEDESSTVTESDKLPEFLSKLPETIADQEKTEDDDNEAEISEYLTLAQLGNILRELSVKGLRLYTLSILNKRFFTYSKKVWISTDSGLLLVGDFNKLDLNYVKNAHGLKQIVPFPTRGSSMLDLVFTNLGAFYEVPIKRPNFGLSDHVTVEVKPLARSDFPKNKIIIKSRDLRTTKRLAIRKYLEEVDLDLLVGTKVSCEEKTNTLESVIKLGMDTLLPLRSKKLSVNDPPWINKQLKSMIRKRQRALARGDDAIFRRL